MCGIMGFFDKQGTYHHQLGAVLLNMLTALGCRGPDSAGVALYKPRRDGAQVVRIKLGSGDDLDTNVGRLIGRVERVARIRQTARVDEYLYLAIQFSGDQRALENAIESSAPEVEVISWGTALDIVKQVGSPDNLEAQFHISGAHGTHAIAHTRLSTESKIDLSHSQPFWAHGTLDLATVHNGHITNYYKLRHQYEQRGVRFYTENDSEIIAVYLAEQMRAGATFEEALCSSVGFFDGSFSYLAATASEIGFAKDAFGFKPLIVAETDAYVAFATEEIALSQLTAGGGVTWEPPAGTVRTWNINAMRSAA